MVLSPVLPVSVRILTSPETLDARRPAGSGYTSKVRVRDKYHIVGFISSGTYGRVYKAVAKDGRKGEFAIKKYVPFVVGEA